MKPHRRRSIVSGRIVFLAFFLTGCAAMDLSLLETANTLEQQPFRISVYSNIGLEPTSAVHIDSVNSAAFNQERPRSWFLIGVNPTFRLTRDMDLSVRFWLPLVGRTTGFKLNVKRRLYAGENGLSIALFPGISYMTSNYTEDEDIFFRQDEWELYSWGAEIPVIISKTIGRGITIPFIQATPADFDLYGSLRYSYNYIDVITPSRYFNYHTRELHRLGILGGLSVSTGFGISLTEIGLEAIQLPDGRIFSLPIISSGFTIKF